MKHNSRPRFHTLFRQKPSHAQYLLLLRVSTGFVEKFCNWPILTLDSDWYLLNVASTAAFLASNLLHFCKHSKAHHCEAVFWCRSVYQLLLKGLSPSHYVSCIDSYRLIHLPNNFKEQYLVLDILSTTRSWPCTASHAQKRYPWRFVHPFRINLTFVQRLHYWSRAHRQDLH